MSVCGSVYCVVQMYNSSLNPSFSLLTNSDFGESFFNFLISSSSCEDWSSTANLGGGDAIGNGVNCPAGTPISDLVVKRFRIFFDTVIFLIKVTLYISVAPAVIFFFFVTDELIQVAFEHCVGSAWHFSRQISSRIHTECVVAVCPSVP